MTLPIKLSSPATREFWEIPVLFEDDDLLVLDKPGNILTAPDQSHPDQPNLSELIHQGIREEKPWAKQRNLSYLTNGHRLDFDVGGALCFAKSESVLHHLTNLFGSEKPLLECVTIVRGAPADESFEVMSNITEDANRPGLMDVDAVSGKKAITRFEVIERFHRWTLLRCIPLTQRTHQIRVHLREIKHPVAGDRDYGGRPLMLSSIKPDYRLKPGRKERPLIDETLVHAEKLSIPHPRSGDNLVVKSEWPKELKVAVKYLRQFASA